MQKIWYDPNDPLGNENYVWVPDYVNPDEWVTYNHEGKLKTAKRAQYYQDTGGPNGGSWFVRPQDMWVPEKPVYPDEALGDIANVTLEGVIGGVTGLFLEAALPVWANLLIGGAFLGLTAKEFTDTKPEDRPALAGKMIVEAAIAGGIMTAGKPMIEAEFSPSLPFEDIKALQEMFQSGEDYVAKMLPEGMLNTEATQQTIASDFGPEAHSGSQGGTVANPLQGQSDSNSALPDIVATPPPDGTSGETSGDTGTKSDNPTSGEPSSPRQYSPEVLELAKKLGLKGSSGLAEAKAFFDLETRYGNEKSGEPIFKDTQVRDYLGLKSRAADVIYPTQKGWIVGEVKNQWTANIEISDAVGQGEQTARQLIKNGETIRVIEINIPKSSKFATEKIWVKGYTIGDYDPVTDTYSLKSDAQGGDALGIFKTPSGDTVQVPIRIRLQDFIPPEG